MTSDAKIGLILGLVFIFIIAFIINGLPKIHGETNSDELTTNLVGLRNEQVGLGAKERRASEAYNWSERLREESANKRRSSSADNSGNRYEALLPDYASVVKDNLAGKTVSNGDAKGGGPLRTVDKKQPAPGPVGNRKGRENRPAPADIKSVKPQIHTVVDGDNLSVIAKKVYGSEEGNRWVNITRIFEANRKVLKSRDEVFIGQKLIIPLLPASASGKPKGGDVLSGSKFEKAENVVGRRGPSVSGKQASRGRYYVVKDGDSLWKVAAEELGKASRYLEIVKLNADILANEDDLSIGMRLKIPAQKASTQ